MQIRNKRITINIVNTIMFNASMILHKYFYLHEVLQIFREGHRLLQPIPLTHNDTQTKTHTHTHILKGLIHILQTL